MARVVLGAGEKGEGGDTVELKPCPICGAKAFISHNNVDGFDFGWSVGCPRFRLADGIHGFDYDTPEDEVERHRLTGFYYPSKERAVEAWNDRVEAGEWRISPWKT